MVSQQHAGIDAKPASSSAAEAAASDSASC